MTFDDLQRTLTEAAAAGEIGRAAALRVHLCLSDAAEAPCSRLAAVVAMADRLFSCRPEALAVREHANRRQWNLLLKYAGGQTLLATLGTAPATSRSDSGDPLHLLLVGNHGTMRLEGEKLTGTIPAASPEAEKRLKSAASRSEEAGGFVPWEPPAGAFDGEGVSAGGP